MDGGVDQGRGDGSSKKKGEGWLFQRGASPGKGSGKGWLGGRGGCKGFGCRGVGGRGTGVSGRGTGPRDGANFATGVVFLSFLMRTKRRKMLFLKDALWGGGGYPPELAWWTGG